MKKHTQTHRGFTLPELLIILFIISILSAIAIATFRQYFQDVRDSTRSAHISSVVHVVKTTQAQAESDQYNFTPAQLTTILTDQGVAIPKDPGNQCYLYGYSTSGFDFFVVNGSEKTPDTLLFGGTGASRKIIEDNTETLQTFLTADCIGTAPTIPGYDMLLLDNSISAL